MDQNAYKKKANKFVNEIWALLMDIMKDGKPNINDSDFSGNTMKLVTVSKINIRNVQKYENTQLTMDFNVCIYFIFNRYIYGLILLEGWKIKGKWKVNLLFNTIRSITDRAP